MSQLGGLRERSADANLTSLDAVNLGTTRSNGVARLVAQYAPGCVAAGVYVLYLLRTLRLPIRHVCPPSTRWKCLDDDVAAAAVLKLHRLPSPMMSQQQ